jgi:hypothetical protein
MFVTDIKTNHNIQNVEKLIKSLIEKYVCLHSLLNEMCFYTKKKKFGIRPKYNSI